MSKHAEQIHKALSTKRALTEEEAAAYIGMSRSFMRQSRMNGKRDTHIPPPTYIRVGKRSIRYLVDDLDAWLAQFERVTAA